MHIVDAAQTNNLRVYRTKKVREKEREKTKGVTFSSPLEIERKVFAHTIFKLDITINPRGRSKIQLLTPLLLKREISHF